MKQVETKHEIIENYYINLIESNKVSAGEQLPSENEIASLFNVSRHTVRQALNYLSQEGWIYKRSLEKKAIIYYCLAVIMIWKMKRAALKV